MELISPYRIVFDTKFKALLEFLASTDYLILGFISQYVERWFRIQILEPAILISNPSSATF